MRAPKPGIQRRVRERVQRLGDKLHDRGVLLGWRLHPLVVAFDLWERIIGWPLTDVDEEPADPRG
jgi:hypothetical protein